MEELKLKAFLEHFNIEDADLVSADRNIYEYDGKEYIIRTYEEADEELRYYYQDLVDDTLRYEIPEHLRPYFNEKDYLEDLVYDSNYSAISYYDGDWEEIRTTNKNGILHAFILIREN